MDFAMIKSMAGAETAQKLCDHDYFNSHTGQAAGDDIDGETLDSIIKGAAVLGAEPVDYPLTDGVYIYLKRRTGDIVALLIESWDADEQRGGSGFLRISQTDIA